MRHFFALLVCLAGCHSDALLSGSSADLSSATDASFAPDAALASCALATGNSAVFISADVRLLYGWLGGVDAGSYANCGGNPEAIRVWLSSSRTPHASGAIEFAFSMNLPVALGMQSVTITPQGGGSEVMGMVTITSRTPSSSGPGLEMLEGDLSTSVAQGHFAVSHCIQLDEICI